eukprot:1144346-Rhodomonas_salina.2
MMAPRQCFATRTRTAFLKVRWLLLQGNTNGLDEEVVAHKISRMEILANQVLQVTSPVCYAICYAPVTYLLRTCCAICYAPPTPCPVRRSCTRP